MQLDRRQDRAPIQDVLGKLTGGCMHNCIVLHAHMMPVSLSCFTTVTRSRSSSSVCGHHLTAFAVSACKSYFEAFTKAWTRCPYLAAAAAAAASGSGILMHHQ